MAAQGSKGRGAGPWGDFGGAGPAGLLQRVGRTVAGVRKSSDDGAAEEGKGVICVFFFWLSVSFFLRYLCLFSFLGLKSQEMASYAQVIE